MDADIKQALDSIKELFKDSLAQMEKRIEDKITALTDTLKSSLELNGGEHKQIKDDIRQNETDIGTVEKKLIVVENKVDKAHERIDTLYEDKKNAVNNTKWSIEMRVLMFGIIASLIVSILGLIM